MGKIINSVFLFLLVGLILLVLSGYLANEVLDLLKKNKAQVDVIEQKDQTIQELSLQNAGLLAELDSEQQTRQAEQARADTAEALYEAAQLELAAKDAELAAARQELFQAAAELAATKQNWQKTIVALIKTWQDYEQAKNELGDSEKMLDVAVQQLVRARQERDVLRYQVKVMTITTGEPKTEFNGILPVMYVANLLVLFPALRSVLKINQ